MTNKNNKMFAVEISAPSISAEMGFAMHWVEHGEAQFRGAASFAMCNPMGMVHGGRHGVIALGRKIYHT